MMPHLDLVRGGVDQSLASAETHPYVRGRMSAEKGGSRQMCVRKRGVQVLSVADPYSL